MTNDTSVPSTEDKQEQQQSSSSLSHAAPTLQSQLTSKPDASISRMVRTVTEQNSGGQIDVEAWLSTLNRLYEGKGYSSAQRIVSTIPLLTNEYKTWYEQQKGEIQDDWKLFGERLQQEMVKRKSQLHTISVDNSEKLNRTEATVLEGVIEEYFEKYSGVGNARNWLLHTMNHFKEWGVRRSQQIEAIPLLLENDAYLWYAANSETITSFEIFTKLLLENFESARSISPSTTVSTTRGTVASAILVPDNSFVSHLERTVADDIIKRPTYLRGSQDDVQDWLDKLEQQFTMTQWSDENKLHYISVHLQDDAYRWWTQTSPMIKTWCSFKDAIVRAFGSSRAQELAFEQLKWYKQTINQSVTQYYDKIMELCKKIDPTMPDPLKWKYLMGGIKDSLKMYVALQDPKTTDAFLSLARKIEDIFACTTMSNELIPTDITLNATAYQGQFNQPRFTQISNDNTNRTNVRDTSFTRTYPPSYQNTAARSQVQQPQPLHQEKSSRSTRMNRRSYVCYNCGIPGHYARDCIRSHFQ